MAAAEALDTEPRLGRGVSRLTHLDDLDRIECYARFLEADHPTAAQDTDERTVRQLQGLLLTLLNPKKGELNAVR